jgi:hypothetical protein
MRFPTSLSLTSSPPTTKPNAGSCASADPTLPAVLGDRPAVLLRLHRDALDAGPGVEPGPERPERAVVGGQRTPGEADSRTQELAALVAHALLDEFVRSHQERLGNGQAERLGGLHVDDQLELGGLLHGEIGGLGPLEDLDVISTLASCPA